MKPFLVSLCFGLIAFVFGRPLIAQKNYRDLIIFLIFLSLSFSLSILQILGINIPTPTKGIETMVKLFVTTNFSYQPVGE